MSDAAPNLYAAARDGTCYWTLSIYISAAQLDPMRGDDAGDGGQSGLAGDRSTADLADVLRAAQLRHPPSMALRNAIDPLFNDIADRDFFGKARDFLFAAGLGATDPMSNAPWARLDDARNALLGEIRLQMTLPETIGWATEGITFQCHLPEAAPRDLDLRRFWFAHSDGALSYHLSFAHHYGATARPYSIETYYFLSLLQKLAAPKEFILSDELQARLSAKPGEGFSVLPGPDGTAPIDLGIAPLDGIRVASIGGEPLKFWHYVHDLFVADADILFAEVLGWPRAPGDCAATRHARLSSLLDAVDVLEVPGLKMPRCRYLFHIDDDRMFERLLPVDPDTREALPRKRMVRNDCYKPYRDAIDELMHPIKGGPPAEQVHLGKPPDAGQDYFGWEKLDKRGDYAWALGEGFFLDTEGEPFGTIEAFEKAVVVGGVMQCKRVTGKSADGMPIVEDVEPFKLDIPAYKPGRSDCLDYMFLSGFNQNIIDWLNQDTSEILDSLDPIYPTEALQADERFFVRYANHRGMMTYVAGSRSLEIGNDYIGTCPYAFLIHVLAMHNEFIARDHEKRTAKAIEDVDLEVQRLDEACDGEDDLPDCTPTDAGAILDRSRAIERKINRLKRDSYKKYERHRYLNIFRYDTEGKVFGKMAELRGTDWRGQAMDKALETLEEYAADIDRRQADADRRQADVDRAKRESERTTSLKHWRLEQERLQKVKNDEDERSKQLNILLGTVGAVSGVGVLFNMAEFMTKRSLGWPTSNGEGLSAYIIGNFAMVVAIVGLAVLLNLLVRHFLERRKAKRDKRSAGTQPVTDPDPTPGSPPTISP